MKDEKEQANRSRRQQLLVEVLEHLCSALQLLDSAPAPAQIGARVDQAIHALYDEMADAADPKGCRQIDRNAVPQ